MSLSLLPSSSSLYSSVAASGSMPASSYVRREMVAAALRPAILRRIRLSPSQRSLLPPRRPTPTPWRGSSHGGRMAWRGSPTVGPPGRALAAATSSRPTMPWRGLAGGRAAWTSSAGSGWHTAAGGHGAALQGAGATRTSAAAGGVARTVPRVGRAVRRPAGVGAGAVAWVTRGRR